jgi:hypothetical protein
MKALLSAATFGLLPTPLPHAVDLNRQLMMDLGSQPRPASETAEGEPYEDEGPMRQSPRQPRCATAAAAKVR